MKSLLFSILAVLFLFPSLLFSQSDPSDSFLPGFVITHDGDTLVGSVRYIDHNFNRQQCQFREGPNKETRSFKPNQIQGYFVEGKGRYMAAEMIEDEVKSWGFLAYVLDADLSLLHYQDRYFVAGKRGLEELIIIIDTLETGDQIRYQKRHLYRNQLLQRMYTCSGIPDQIQQTTYDLQSLRALFLIYYECSSQDYHTFVSRKKWSRIQLGVGVSAQILWMGIKGTNGSGYHFEEAPAEYIYPVKPYIWANLSFPGRNHRFDVRMGLSYAQYDYLFSDVNDQTGRDLLYELPYEMSTMEIPITLTYSLNRSRTGPYLLAGISSAIVLRHFAERRVILSSGTELSNFPITSPEYYPSFQAGAGIKFVLGETSMLFAEVLLDRSANIGGSSGGTLAYQPNIFMTSGVLATGIFF